MEKLNTNILKNKEVIIFDLDGTLINTIDIWNKVDYLVLKKHKINISKKEIQKIRDNYLLNNTNDNIYLNYSKYLVEKYNIDKEVAENMAIDYGKDTGIISETEEEKYDKLAAEYGYDEEEEDMPRKTRKTRMSEF